MKVLISLVLLLGIVFSGCDETDEINPTQNIEVFCKNSVNQSVTLKLFRYKSEYSNFELDSNELVKTDSGKIDNFGPTFSTPFELDSAIITFSDGTKLVQVQTSNRVFTDTVNCILNSFDYAKTYDGDVEKWTFTLTQADYERAR